jgi:hypothetical protein
VRARLVLPLCVCVCACACACVSSLELSPKGACASTAETKGEMRGGIGVGRAGMGGEEARPMTSIRAAGYTSSGRVGTSAGQPGGSALQGPAPPLEVKTSNKPEDVARCLNLRT